MAAHRIRPFRYWATPGGRGVWPLEGWIRLRAYALEVAGARVELATWEAGRDALGPYAIVEGGTYRLGNGLCAALEWDDEACVSTRLVAFDPAAPPGAFAANRSARVYFRRDGMFAGGEITLLASAPVH
jgi:hypothetical protein